MYRGYDIADLAEHSTYEETAYLLLHGELPDADGAARRFERALARSRAAGRTRSRSIDSSASDAAPMDMLRTVASMLSFGDRRATDATDRESGLARRDAPDRAAADGDRAAITARRQGLEPVAPDASLAYAENFLTMLHGERPTSARRASSTSR